MPVTPGTLIEVSARMREVSQPLDAATHTIARQRGFRCLLHRARQAARTVPKWRETIGAVTPGVQHFTSSFLHPAPFSPWQ